METFRGHSDFAIRQRGHPDFFNLMSYKGKEAQIRTHFRVLINVHKYWGGGNRDFANPLGGGVGVPRCCKSFEESIQISPGQVKKPLPPIMFSEWSHYFNNLKVRCDTDSPRFQVPDSRSQTPGPRLQVPGPRFQVPDYRSQMPGPRLQVPDSSSQTPGPRFQVLDSRSQTPGHRLQVTDSRYETSKAIFMVLQSYVPLN